MMVITGTYLEIVKVEAPSTASYGSTVPINIYVKNKWTSRIFATVTGAYDTTPVSSDSHYIDPGAQRIFGFSFTMPNKTVNLWIWAWYWTATGWSASPDDEYGPVTIALPAPTQWVAFKPVTITVPSTYASEWVAFEPVALTVPTTYAVAEWVAFEPVLLTVPHTYGGDIRNITVDFSRWWPGGEHPIPYTSQPVPVGTGYFIRFDGCNLSDVMMRLKGDIWITSPTGQQIYHSSGTSDVAYPLPVLGPCHGFVFRDCPPVDEEGEYRLRIELRNSTGEFLLAKWEGILFSTQPILKGDVGGTVKDAETGYPIEGAVVSVDETGQSDITANTGEYLIRDVPQGKYTVTAAAKGYQSASQSDITVTSEKLVIVRFALTKAAVGVGIPTWMIGAGIAGAAAIGVAAYYSKKKKIKKT